MRKIFVNGEWVEGLGFAMESVAPEDLRVLDLVPVCRGDDVQRAVDAARSAALSWSGTSVAARAQLVSQLADLLVDAYGNEGEPTSLKELLFHETGKRLPEADIEVIESSDMVRYFSAMAEDALAPKTPELDQALWATKTSTTILEPRGVVAIVKPWNYPLELPLWSIAPALVAGNTIVFKPSENSSLIGLHIAGLIEAAGFPPGVVNVVTGDGETGRLLVSNPDVNMVSFTGSVSTGLAVAKVAAERLIHCSLELGGNDAAIVLPNADLELAANGISWGAICNSGQVCTGVKRVIVVDEVYDEFLARLTLAIEQLRAGVDYGPIISRRQLASIRAAIADAIGKGARLLTGGSESAIGPLYLTPAVLADVPSSADIALNECFGPVAPVFRANDVEDAILKTNDSEYGLGASVWTRSHEDFTRVAARLGVGMVWENDVNVALPQAPWAGRRNSGTGCDLSKWGLYEYVEPKHICREASAEQRRAWWYPYGDADA